MILHVRRALLTLSRGIIHPKEERSRSLHRPGLSPLGYPRRHLVKLDLYARDHLSPVEFRLHHLNPSPLLYPGLRLSKQFQEHPIKLYLPLIILVQEQGHHPMQASVLQFRQLDSPHNPAQHLMRLLHILDRVNYLDCRQHLRAPAPRPMLVPHLLSKPALTLSTLHPIDLGPTYLPECNLLPLLP